MAEAGAREEQGAEGVGTPGVGGGGDPEAGSDWAGLPEDLLVKIAETLVAQTEAGYLKGALGWPEERIQDHMAERKREGLGLFVFARVCKGWRKAQLKVGGPLRTRVKSDVIPPGSVALVKWALAEGCPRERTDYYGNATTMANFAAWQGHLELVKWLCGKEGFVMDWRLMWWARRSGDRELLQLLRSQQPEIEI